MMQKEIIKNEILGEQHYCYRHQSGLSVILYPMDGFQSSFALFGTNYGSIDTTFKTDKETNFTTVPEGIAHFLEHKLFESEDGDAFTLFAKTGASANAFTSFDKTCYLFSTTDNFAESLKALMTFVQEPYFTQETVLKEQGIIGQEIQMYRDDPNWRVLTNLLCALYHNNPVRIDIAGTIDSISKIDKDLLYSCYNTFYNLSNMVVCIAGNFDEKEAAKIIEESLKECEKIQVETKIPDEPDTIAQKESLLELSVSIPLFYIGFKEAVPKKEDELSTQLITELILSAIAGKGSDLYREMYESSLINETFGEEVFCGRGYFAPLFCGESKNPHEVMAKIRAEIEKLKETGVKEEAFTRLKRSMYGNAVVMFNDVSQLAQELVSAYFSGESVYETLNIIKNMTLSDVNNRLRSSFDFDKMAISIVNPISKA